jgi:hypothetical protein
MGFSRLALLVPTVVGFVLLVARMVTSLGLGAAAGAVKKPVELMVPTVALPPATPPTDHVKAPVAEPSIVALNCCVSPARTVAEAGVTVTPVPGSGSPPPGIPPTVAHPAMTSTEIAKTRASM